MVRFWSGEPPRTERRLPKVLRRCNAGQRIESAINIVDTSRDLEHFGRYHGIGGRAFRFWQACDDLDRLRVDGLGEKQELESSKTLFADFNGEVRVQIARIFDLEGPCTW